MLIVQKFGGSSVANTQRVMNVAQRVAQSYKDGNEVIVVLSAQGDTTDELISKAKEITVNPPKRELDMLLTTGEQQSVALMAMALSELNIPAISLNGYQVNLRTTSDYTNARIRNIKTSRIKTELARRNVVIITGFQGVNRYEDLTTLGRGGSDTTAVAIAAAIHANKCEIYTDVEGVYTADPRVVPNATKLDEINYNEMLELASLGAKVLHNRSVELAKKYNVDLVVRSSLTTAEGTVVKEVTMEKMLISGVAGDDNVARISLLGIEDKPGKAFQIFSTLGKNKINVDIIIQSIATDGRRNISFSIDKDYLNEAKEIVDSNAKRWGATGVEYDENLAKVSVVGAGMVANAGVASKVFEAMYDEDINIHMISTSEIKISVLIDNGDMKRAMRAIHDKFDLGQ
ncbi:MAG: aspartate kinase [Epulopiscium sp. Nele67-Bin002]|nr:MAG: aspartate kinase [Epulopiscium sp. Nuni2H_MBin001]OON90795.1 MAG: aspartate kinase [Epulopiscium sp. Nele67-Bin002]OON90874.1 MAG: aspartate kinase [Epulopiscium sp. Nele67-Bin001]